MTPQTRLINRSVEDAKRRQDTEGVKMSKFVRITRSESPGVSYIQPSSKISEAMQGEFDCIDDMVVGESITLTVIEMDTAEYKKLPEFDGW